MIKKILLGSLMLLSLHTFAQEGTASPYSFYGIGDVRFKGTIENRAMGSIGILPDSIHINLQNPASLSAMKLTSFTVAGTYNTLSLKTSDASEKARRTTLDYLAMAFPVGKLGLSFGLMPYSSVGYKIQKLAQDDVSESSRYTGIGGLNKVFLGAGYQITPKLSAGLELGYNFGKIETSSAVFFPGVQYGSRELNKSELHGVNLNSGFIYKTKLKKYDFVSSLTFSPSITLRSSNTRNIAAITYSFSGAERVFSSHDIDVADSKLKLPSKLALGSGLGDVKKWFVGFETTFQQASDFGNLYTNDAQVSFDSSTRIAIGGYYIPNYNSFSNYFSKVTYRAGFRHENTGLVIHDEPIRDTAMTLGFGFPVGGNFSNINVGLEFGKKGTTNANLIQENYMNISIGLSFNDKWFVKRKFD
ncbi:hypothetical protein [Flavobacterium sp.]|uniref:hypothetical protein n=1 Tax=Flavobacterium sp. TaxID=239 RepID=UPI002614F94B|nr:hypothetical protein [Flavobacterium sp.]